MLPLLGHSHGQDVVDTGSQWRQELDTAWCRRKAGKWEEMSGQWAIISNKLAIGKSRQNVPIGGGGGGRNMFETPSSLLSMGCSILLLYLRIFKMNATTDVHSPSTPWARSSSMCAARAHLLAARARNNVISFMFLSCTQWGQCRPT